MYDYDVFLSHNGRDKPWVRSLHELLVRKGLSVFFDEKSIRLGQAVPNVIGKALDKSKKIVVVLSPAALASDWVALEYQVGVMNDPGGSHERLLQVKIASVPNEAIPAILRFRKYADLTNRKSRKANLSELLEALGVNATDAELEKLCGDLDRLEVAGFDEVCNQWNWTGEDLLRALIDLDYRTLRGLTDENEGSVRQWAPVFMSHPQSWRLLTTGPREISGYWHFASLFPEDFARAKAGELFDNEITVARVQPFGKAKSYDIYFVQFCLDFGFRGPQYLFQLTQSIRDVLKDLTNAGIQIGEVCANAYTDEGYAMCRFFHLTEGVPHKSHGTIFTARMVDLLKRMDDA